MFNLYTNLLKFSNTIYLCILKNRTLKNVSSSKSCLVENELIEFNLRIYHK